MKEFDKILYFLPIDICLISGGVKEFNNVSSFLTNSILSFQFCNTVEISEPEPISVKNEMCFNQNIYDLFLF